MRLALIIPLKIKRISQFKKDCYVAIIYYTKQMQIFEPVGNGWRRVMKTGTKTQHIVSGLLYARPCTPPLYILSLYLSMTK